MISGLTERTFEERLKVLGIVTLEERMHQMDMLQTYKIGTEWEGEGGP
jgi:hypothetical protein